MHGMPVEVRGQLCRVGSLAPRLCGYQGLNLGCRLVQEALSHLTSLHNYSQFLVRGDNCILSRTSIPSFSSLTTGDSGCCPTSDCSGFVCCYSASPTGRSVESPRLRLPVQARKLSFLHSLADGTVWGSPSVLPIFLATLTGKVLHVTSCYNL